jgi:murein DD-endopeptidase MepM/ murein hydrolase activator NlpD
MRNRLSLRGAVIAAALIECGVLIALVLYLALTDRALRISLEPRMVPVIASTEGLVIPVAGVRAAELRNSWGAARSGGRAHKGVDIFAKEGTPVLAAAAGVLVNRDSNGVGGLSLYQRGADGRIVYYYAHLSGTRAGLKVGDLLAPGDVIGYVGRTGNVSGAAHLHFAAFTITDPNRWWHGRDLNPYDLLKPAAAP